MNLESRQTEAFSQSDGRYWHVCRKGSMSAFNNLPKEVRDYMNENFCHTPAEDALWDYQNTHGGNVQALLEELRHNDEVLNNFDKKMLLVELAA